MTALLRKELRLLAPTTIVALLAAGVFALWPDSKAEPRFVRETRGLFLMLGYVVTVVSVATTSVGREISGNTLAGQLALPVRRSAVWRAKVLTLAASVLLTFAAWRLALILNPFSLLTPGENLDSPLWLGWVAATAFAGGLTIPLLVRQSSTAFALTIVAPALIAAVANLVAPFLGEQVTSGTCVGVALACYTVAGVIGSYWLFVRAEDRVPLTTSVTAPTWVHARLGLPRILRRAGSTSRGRRALFAKELRFFEPVLLLGAALALIHLGLIGARSLAGGFRLNSTAELVASGFWYLWLVMPLLLGAMAVADERRHGTHEAQLCLPVSRRTQFLIKVGVGATLALLFGGVLPHLLEGGRTLPELREVAGPSTRQPIGAAWAAVRHGLGPAARFVVVAPAPLLLFACGFFASTLTRHVLRALGLGVLLAGGVWLYPECSRTLENPPAILLWEGQLIHLIAVPAVLVAVAALAYRNSTHVRVGWPQVRRTLVCVVTVVAGSMLLTAAIYQRAWELLLPREPVHGAPRFEQRDVVRFDATFGGVITELADGHAAAHRITVPAPTWFERLSGDRRLTPVRGDGPLPEGAWKSIVDFPNVILALDEGGRLWSTTSDETDAAGGDHLALVRYDAAEDWIALAQLWPAAYAVKADGSLWRVTEATKREREKDLWQIDRVAFRIGTSNEWADVYPAKSRLVFRTRDERTYIAPPFDYRAPDLLKLEGIRSPLERMSTPPTRDDQTEVTWIRPRRNFAPYLRVSLHSDGSLVTRPVERPGKPSSEPVIAIGRLGAGHRWRGIACIGEHLVTLREDGTLWRWSRRATTRGVDPEPTCVQLGSSSDWRAIHGTDLGVAALAADGTIWHWPLDNNFSSSFRPLLGPTRRPQFVANIFSVTP